MKIFTSDQIKEIDRYTIEREPVKSIDLMERAAKKIYDWIISRYGISKRIMIFCGPGNNGGDGLALGRMLTESGYKAGIYYVHFTDRVSTDWETNRNRLNHVRSSSFESIDSKEQFPLLTAEDLIVDAIFGSGLTRSPEGLAAEIIGLINESVAETISIDIPSGLFGEDNTGNNMDAVIRAKVTLCFQFPRLSFMFAENYSYTGDVSVLPIGLHPSAIRDTETDYHYLEAEDVRSLIRMRQKFDHKGKFGHGLLIAGSKGKAGAAVLGAKAALRTGVGLLTCYSAGACCDVLQVAVPEAMVRYDDDEAMISSLEGLSDFSAIGAGPGIGQQQETRDALFNLLKKSKSPMVLDADALNILSLNKDWFPMLQPGTILTPHPREFERLAGTSENSYKRLETQKEFSRKNICNVIVKGANTSITTLDGKVYFNSTGNPGMATAGSGDVLTGIILSLLSQGYSPPDAAIAGVYLHGLAGDVAAEDRGYESLTASDIIEHIGAAYAKLR